MSINENKQWSRKFYSLFKGLVILMPILICLLMVYQSGINSIDTLNDLVSSFIELPILKPIYTFFNDHIINSDVVINSVLYNCVFGLMFYIVFVYVLFFIIDIFVWFINLTKNLVSGGGHNG